MKKITTYRIPTRYAVALINNDWSALSDDDTEDLTAWLDRVQPGHATVPDDGEPFFCPRNDVSGYIGDICYDITFIQ